MPLWYLRRKAPYYDAGRGLRLWRATDIGLHKVEICADSYRVKCPKHGVVAASVPWARHNSRYTLDFEQTVAWLATNCSKTAVSRFMRMSWNSVGPVISRIRADLDIVLKTALPLSKRSVLMKPAIVKAINT